MKREQYLILIRHAHRDTSFRQMDNGLSERGLAQVSALTKYFQKRWLPVLKSEVIFSSSPKKRCIETLAPVAHLFEQELEVNPLLDEHNSEETHVEFSHRLESFKNSLFKETSSVVACSHGDWIPQFLRVSIGHPLPIKKSGVFVLKCMGNEQFKLVELVTQWKSFSLLL